MRQISICGALIFLDLASSHCRGQQSSNSPSSAHTHPATMAHGEAASSQPGGMDHSMSSMHGFYGLYPMSREASGTAWQPEATPMGGWHYMKGDWMFMFHGFAFGIYDHQGGPRGDEKFLSANMFMGMAQHPLGNGTLGMRTMLSLEPVTIGKNGYPELLQTGETADGKTALIDRQHPHDLFMELAASYSLPLNESSSAFAYLGYPGEPALGPATFMHRFSGADNPEAPITHHWLDSTHITFGVVTLGYIWKDLKIDGSVFTGREPDEHRWDFDRPRFDSYSGRLTYNQTKNWSMQVSYGNIESPEELEPDRNVERLTASVSYHHTWNESNWQTTLAWGRNFQHPGPDLNGVLIESVLNHSAHTIFGRAEYVQKDELFEHGDPFHGEVFDVGKLTAGYIFDFANWQKVRFGVGGSGSIFIIPDRLESAYGDTPLSFLLFIRAKL